MRSQRLNERSEPPSLQGFHHWITSHEAEVKRDLEQGGGAVRIMTVHGAKGLEAPIVILPDTCQPPDQRNDPRVLWLEDDMPIPVWVPNSELHTAPTRAARSLTATPPPTPACASARTDLLCRCG